MAEQGEAADAAIYHLPSGTEVRGDPLEDRIRFGMESSIPARTAIGLNLARTLEQLHGRQKYVADLSVRTVLLGLENVVQLAAPATDDKKLKPKNIRDYGLILYQLLNGELVHSAGTAPDMEELYRAGLPSNLVDVVERCLEEPEHYSMKKVVHDLEALSRVSPEGPTTWRNPQVLAIAVLGGLAGLSALAWMIL